MMLRIAASRPLLGAVRAQVAASNNQGAGKQLTRYLMNSSGSGRTGAFGGKTTRLTLRERLSQPTTGLPFALGQGVVMGVSALGLGALCFYGAGMSSEAGALENSIAWPEYVKERIRSTYMYFGGSIILTAGSAAAVFRSQALMNLVMKNSMLAVFASIAAMIGSGMIVRSIPYKEGFGAKQMAWMFHTAVIGTVIAPIALMGGPLLLRAALYTAGIVGGLSAVAACAPSEKFLNMGGPLAIGFGFVFAASLGSMFMAPTTALGAGLYSLSIYGGLVLFSAFLLYDTQRIVKKAETYPYYGVAPYDPVNASVSIYLDTINIFIRIASILASGGGKKR